MTPKSSVDSVRVSTKAPAPPASTPIATRTSAWPTISRSTEAALGAERHPDADFPHAPGDVVAEHAVDADRAERKRERGEQADEQHREPPLGNRARERAIERFDREDGQRGIALADDAADRRRECERIAGRPDEQCAGAIGRRRLRKREVGGEGRLFAEAASPFVGDDADDRPRRAEEAQLRAERIAVAEEAANGRVVDQHDRRASGAVGTASAAVRAAAARRPSRSIRP